MSPEARQAFEAEWAVLSQRLRLLLIRKRVQPSLHDDVVQETAVRLLSMWDSVNRRRPLWPLTVTIALNLLRDQRRALHRDDPVAEVPDLQSVHDVEAAGLARVELHRVLRAMGELSGSQRSALLKEVGAHATANAPDGSRDKMRRMRARRKLKLALEKVSGLVVLRLRRVSEFVEGMFAIKEGTASVASCGFCLLIGIGAAIAPPAAVAPPATAGQARTTTGSAGYTAEATGWAEMDSDLALRPGHRSSVESGFAGTEAERRGDVGGKSYPKTKTKGAGNVTEDDGGLLDGLPNGDGDQPITPPTSEVGTDIPPVAPPSPPGGAPDADVSTPRPPPPAPPMPIHEPVHGGMLLLARIPKR